MDGQDVKYLSDTFALRPFFFTRIRPRTLCSNSQTPSRGHTHTHHTDAHITHTHTHTHGYFLSQMVSASVDGQVKVWDLRTLSCVQTIDDDIGVIGGGNALNCIEVVPSHKQLLCGSQRLHVYEQVRDAC